MIDIRKIPPPPVFSNPEVVEFGKAELQRQDSSGTSSRVMNDLANQAKF